MTQQNNNRGTKETEDDGTRSCERLHQRNSQGCRVFLHEGCCLQHGLWHLLLSQTVNKTSSLPPSLLLLSFVSPLFVGCSALLIVSEMREKEKKRTEKDPTFPIVSFVGHKQQKKSMEGERDVALVTRVTGTDKANNDEEKSKETLRSLWSGSQCHQLFAILPPTSQRSCPQP